MEAKFRKAIDECCYSIIKSRPTLCHLTGCSTPVSILFHYFLEFAQIHVHLVSDAVYVCVYKYICVYMCLCICIYICIKDEYTYIYIWLCALSHFSRVWLCATLWTAVCQAPLSMGFSRPEYCSGLPFPSPGDLPDPGMEAGLLNCRQILYLLSYQRRKVGLDTMTYPKILLLNSALACASLTGFLVLCIKKSN